MSLFVTLALPACTTLRFTSHKSAEEVSACIAHGWRRSAAAGELPVSLTREEGYYFVDVVLVRDIPTFLPVHSIWAKVRPSPDGVSSGSTTEYRRNFQISHGKIDGVVSTCQRKMNDD